MCQGYVKTDVNGHVRCLHCNDDLGPIKYDLAAQYEQVSPTGSCWECVMGVRFPEPIEEEYTEEDLQDDLLRARLGECPECHQIGACAYDAEGRPMIHVQDPDE